MDDHQEEFTLSEELSLREVLNSSHRKFPILVRTCGNRLPANRGIDDVEDIPKDLIMKLEEEVVVTYAHLKVVALENENEATAKHGPEFTCEYAGFVGDEMMLPANYPVKVNVIHPPGSSRRYAEVAQILEDLPRHIRFETDTLSATLPGQTRGETVKKGTVLEVTHVLNSPHGNVKHMECTAPNKHKYFFSSDQLVNCTAILDDNKYIPSEAITHAGLLPKIVKFEKSPTVDDIAAASCTWINYTIVMAFGPMQLLGSEKRRFIVGWVRYDRHYHRAMYGPDQQQCFNVTLIPEARWESEMVKVLEFHTDAGMQEFMNRKFPECTHARCIEEKVYIMRLEEDLITWLHSDVVLPKEEVIVEPSPDETDDYGYYIPSPPLPPRVPIVKQDHDETEQEEQPHEFRKMVAVKMKLGFEQVHHQLSAWFKHKEKPGTPKHKKDVHKDSSNMPDTTKTSVTKDTPKVAPKPTRPSVKRQESQTRPLPKIPHENVAEDSSQVYEILLEVPEHNTRTVIAEKPRSKKAKDVPEHKKTPTVAEKPKSKKTTDVPEQKKTPAIAEKPKSKKTTDVPEHKKTPTISEKPTLKKSKSKRYETLEISDEEMIMRQNQTKNDFSNYTVSQVSECFRLCALGDLADVCEAKNITGTFLASFDLQGLKKEPFNLTEFRLKKVKMIIHDGWRPHYESLDKKQETIMDSCP